MAESFQRLQTRYCLLSSFCRSGDCTEVFATVLSVCRKNKITVAKASTLACIHAMMP